jgi:hypothetical protein
LERLYNSTFQKQWERTLNRIKFLSPGDLEEMEQQIRKLERYYEISGVKKLSIALGSYPDEYASKINTLKADQCEIISRRFRTMVQKITDLVGDIDELHEFDDERRRFDEALVLFRMLRAFYKRWKLDTDAYHYAGDSTDYRYALKELAYKLAKKRMLLMKEHSSMKRIINYRQKTQVLDEISSEVSKLFDWYKLNYLNIDGMNKSWIGAEELDTPWMVVDLIDDDLSIAPLEKFRNTPTDIELQDVRKMFDRFINFYREHELVDLNEMGALSDYAMFKEYAANFSLYSEDAEERLKAGLMEQMMTLHTVMREVNERVEVKKRTEELFENSFAMYFAPVDEIYSILQKGFICSEHSIHHKYSGKHFDSLVFNVDTDIKDGDIGFIFPMTKVIEGHRFYQVSYNPLVKEGLSESNTYLHLFSHSNHKPLKIDIRLGIFIAPRNKIVRYTVNGQTIKETSEQYFKRFFASLANCDSDWFECDRLQNWLSRHCVFYDDDTREDLLNMLRNKNFVSIINHFTNKKYDNLALSPIHGKLKPTEFFVTHKFDHMPDDMRQKLNSDTFNLTLFEWERHVEE